MNTSDLIAHVNRELARHDADFVPDEGSAVVKSESIHGTINGTPVRLEFTQGNESPPYDHEVWLHSASGDTLGRGNGGDSFEEAIDMYHWNAAVTELNG